MKVVVFGCRWVHEYHYFTWSTHCQKGNIWLEDAKKVLAYRKYKEGAELQLEFKPRVEFGTETTVTKEHSQESPEALRKMISDLKDIIASEQERNIQLVTFCNFAKYLYEICRKERKMI